MIASFYRQLQSAKNLKNQMNRFLDELRSSQYFLKGSNLQWQHDDQRSL